MRLINKLIVITLIGFKLANANQIQPIDVYGGIPEAGVEKVKFETLGKGVDRFAVHGDMGSFAIFKFAKGSKVPFHKHLSESIIYVHSGELKVNTIEAGKVKEYKAKAGEIFIVKSSIPNASEALFDSLVTISSAPIRKDWVNKPIHS